MKRPSTVPKLQINLLQKETDPIIKQLKEFYQLTNTSVDKFIEDLLIVTLSNSDDRQQVCSLSERSELISAGSIGSFKSELLPKSFRSCQSLHPSVSHGGLCQWQSKSNPSSPSPWKSSMNGLPNFRFPVNRHPVDVFSAYDDEFIPYRSGRSSVPANLLHATGGFQSQVSNYLNEAPKNIQEHPNRQQPTPPPRINFGEVQNWQKKQQNQDFEPSWNQHTDFRPIRAHGTPSSTTTVNTGRDPFDALLASYNDCDPQPYSNLKFGASTQLDQSSRGPQPYYSYRRSTSSLGDAKPKPVTAGLDPLRQTNREQLVVPLHIRNPFSTPENKEAVNNALPKPTHQTFSEPSNQAPHALDILSTSLYDPNSSYYNQRNINFDHFEPSPQTTRKFLNLKTSTRDQNRDYFDEDDFGGRFVAELLNDEMNKTTPTWKSTFVAKRDRFGAANSNEDMPAPFTHNYTTFSSNGLATLPNQYRNRALTKSSSSSIVGNGSNTLDRIESNRSSSLLRDAVNRRTNSMDNKPLASTTLFGSFELEPTAKQGIGKFWIDTVRNRSASPNFVIARAPFKMTTAAERLEQLHEPVDDLDRSSYQNEHTSNGVDVFSSSRNNFSNESAACVTSNIQQNGLNFVAQRQSQFLPEMVGVFNQGAKPFPSQRFISERKANGHAPNFASLDNAVADLRQNTHRLLDSSRGCARFPTTEEQFPSAITHGISRPVTFGTRMSPPRAQVTTITRATAHSPSPDSLSGESTTSLANLPHPRPRHNIREQLMNAGVGNTYLGPYRGRRPGTPIFPSPTNGSSVASRISDFEQRPNMPNLQLAITTPSNDTPRSPLSPRTTVFRKQAVIQYNNGHRGGATSPEYDNRRVSTVSTSASFTFPTKTPASYSPRWRDDPTNEASPLAWSATNNSGTTSVSSASSQAPSSSIAKKTDRQRQFSVSTAPLKPIALLQPRATTAKTITFDETSVSQGVSAVIPSGASQKHSTASLYVAAATLMPPLPKLSPNLVGKLANTPRFHFPAGKPVSKADNDCMLNRIGSFINSMPTKTIIQKDFDEIALKLGLPLYCKQGIYEACCRVNDQNPEDSPAINFSAFAKYFNAMIDSAHDEEARFIFTLSVAAHGLPAQKFLTRENFHSIFYDLIETYPGLKFLIDSKQFHARYVEVVVARIFWNVNRSWTGRLTYAELKKSNFIATMHLLETTDEINKITDYFSYEHFYVTYCKFWEIDIDHLMILTRDNMCNHNGGVLTNRVIDRIFSPAVTRIPNQQTAARKNNRGPVREERIETIGFEEFVAFLLAEEDKRHPTSIEYWFRCLDLDGDGIISMYEMELFYDDIVAKIHQKDFETLAFSDVANQLIDLVNPKDGNIRLSDLKTCGLAHRFFNTFVNYMKYLEQESADGERASVKMNGDKEMSDWEQFCAVEYEILMSETENGDEFNDEAYDVNLDDDDSGLLETTYSLDNNVISSLSVRENF